MHERREAQEARRSEEDKVKEQEQAANAYLVSERGWGCVDGGLVAVLHQLSPSTTLDPKSPTDPTSPPQHLNSYLALPAPGAPGGPDAQQPYGGGGYGAPGQPQF